MEPFALRPYQIIALEVMHGALQAQDILLLQAATGAGKTIIITRMINRYFHDHQGRRFLILMHKRELVEQFMSAFIRFTNVPPSEVGIVCSGMNRRQLDRRVTIGTIQTFVNCLDEFPGADLVVVDETHRVGHASESQYQQILDRLREYKPDHKVIGVTATAYRLGHGMIYGDRCKPGRVNFFPDLTHRITYQELRDSGYLMPLVGKIAAPETLTADLLNVDVSGDYNLTQLGGVMGRPVYIKAAVEAYRQYGMHHQHVCVFACTIEHCEALVAEFRADGFSAVPIHSKLSSVERTANLAGWRAGKYSIAVSVNILIEGFDFKALSCLIFCRPTKSPTVFIQAIGRILRMEAGKSEALLIDLTNNAASFGFDLDNPRFTIPSGKDGAGEAPTKVCGNEQCLLPVHAALRVCPHCGFEFPLETIPGCDAVGEMKHVEFNVPDPPEWYEVESMEIGEFCSKKSGKMMGRIVFEYGGLYRKKIVSQFFCLPDQYSGYAVERSMLTWRKFCDEPFPQTVDEFTFLRDFIRQPVGILLDENGKYAEIKDFDFTGEKMDAIRIEDVPTTCQYGAAFDGIPISDEVPF